MALDMRLKTLMKNKVPNPNFEGLVMVDDYAFAINTTPGINDKVAEFVVGEVAVTGLESSLNAETKESTYLRAGKSTTKIGTQRTFTYNADRYAGDPFQEFCLSIKDATGQDVITDYVYFNIKTGKGEKGKVSVIVDSDGGGSAGENATVTINFNKVGEKPTEYTWADDSTTITVANKEKL